MEMKRLMDVAVAEASVAGILSKQSYLMQDSMDRKDRNSCTRYDMDDVNQDDDDDDVDDVNALDLVVVCDVDCDYFWCHELIEHSCLVMM